MVTFFQYIAEEVREYLADLGFRSLDEAIGHAELLDTTPGHRPIGRPRGLDLSPILAVPRASRRDDRGTRSSVRITAWTRRWTTR